jgi:hypothetical protein
VVPGRPGGSVPEAGDAAPSARGKPAARPRRSNRIWFRLISPLAVLAGWQLVSMTGLISPQKLPPSAAVFHTTAGLIPGHVDFRNFSDSGFNDTVRGS